MGSLNEVQQQICQEYAVKFLLKPNKNKTEKQLAMRCVFDKIIPRASWSTELAKFSPLWSQWTLLK